MKSREKMVGSYGTCWFDVLGMSKRTLATCSGKQSELETQIYVILLVDVETMEVDNIIQDKPVASSEKETKDRTLVITNLRGTAEKRDSKGVRKELKSWEGREMRGVCHGSQRTVCRRKRLVNRVK